MNWEEWEKNATLPVYDPPQLKKGWLNTCRCINWYGIRSPLCPLLAKTIKYCICAESVDLKKEDTWVPQLMRSIHPKCPKEFRGIYWLRDHIQPSTLLTFHDCDWDNQNKLARSLSSNWVKSNTMYGLLSSFSFFIGKTCFDMPIKLLPNGKWIHVNFAGIRTYWLYVFTSDTQIVRKTDGQVIPVFKGDMMRIDYMDSKDPKSKITYMYLIQRIIVPDSQNNFVKRPAYNEFMKRVNKENEEPFFRSESIIRHDTIMSQQHTLKFSIPHKNKTIIR